MACVNSDGTLTASALALLKALASPATAEQVARAAGIPLFRTRSALREMQESALVREDQGVYSLTDAGRAQSAEPSLSTS